MPAAETGASVMPGGGLWRIQPREAGCGAAQAEIDILEIRFKARVEQPDFAEYVGAKERGGPGRGEDAARLREKRAIQSTVAGAPCCGAAADEIERGIDPVAVGGLENFACDE